MPRPSAPVASVRARFDAQALSDRRSNPPPKLERARRLAPAARRNALQEDGVNFAVFSPRATRVWLRLYRGAGRREPLAEIELDAATHRTLRLLARVRRRRARRLALHVARRRAGRARGGLAVRRAARAARPVGAARQRRGLGSRRPRSTATRRRRCVPRSRAADDYDWEGDRPLQRPLQDAVIYELHVARLHAPPFGRRREPGTFRGLVEKIPYLQVARHHRRRAVAGVRVRHAGRAARRRPRSGSATSGATAP